MTGVLFNVGSRFGCPLTIIEKKLRQMVSDDFGSVIIDLNGLMPVDLLNGLG